MAMATRTAPHRLCAAAPRARRSTTARRAHPSAAAAHAHVALSARFATAATALRSRPMRVQPTRAVGRVVAEEGEEEMMIEEMAMEKFEKSLDALETNLQSVRTGRANVQILDRVEVDYYGAPCSLKSLATVTTPDAQTVMVQPFDKTSIGDIERAIMKSDIGMTPSNDGNVIRLLVPQLTKERRAEMAKIASKLGEDAKVALRNVRRDATKQLQKLEKDGTSGKDTIETACKAMDELTNKYVGKIDAAVKAKEEDIMKV